jgi:hypothetical protein
MTNIDGILDYDNCHLRSTVLYTGTADELLICMMPAGNRTRPVEGAWHVCDSFLREENIEYQ